MDRSKSIRQSALSLADPAKARLYRAITTLAVGRANPDDEDDPRQIITHMIANRWAAGIVYRCLKAAPSLARQYPDLVEQAQRNMQ
jgi:hypothetical protein